MLCKPPIGPFAMGLFLAGSMKMNLLVLLRGFRLRARYRSDESFRLGDARENIIQRENSHQSFPPQDIIFAYNLFYKIDIKANPGLRLRHGCPERRAESEMNSSDALVVPGAGLYWRGLILSNAMAQNIFRKKIRTKEIMQRIRRNSIQREIPARLHCMAPRCGRPQPAVASPAAMEEPRVSIVNQKLRS